MTAVKKKGEAMPSISGVLAQVAQRRARIDKLDTEISENIKRIENALREHFSVRIWVNITDSDTDPNAELVLAYGKHDGKWQLLIEHSWLGDDNTTVTPLLSTAREMRTKVFVDGCIEQLILGALAQLDEQIKLREAAIAKSLELAMVLDGVPF